MFQYFFIPLLLVFVWFAAFSYLKWNFKYWSKRKVFGPEPKILQGTFPKTYDGQCNLVEELHEIYKKFKDAHSYVGVFQARSPKLFILDPDVAMQILKTKFTYFHDNESSQWSSLNVEQLRFSSPFVSVGDVWKEKRAELSQALTINKIRSHFNMMQATACKMTEYINIHNYGTVWNAKDLANRFTCDVMTKFIWGIEENTFHDREGRSQIHQMADIMLNQAIRCVHYYGRTAAWPYLRKLWPVRFFPGLSDRFFQQLASTTMRDCTLVNRPSESIVINHLMQLKEKKKLNDLQIAGHTTTVLIDGFETAALVMAHCLLMLARHQRVQSKLRNILESKTVNISSFDELMALPYLDQCIQETLRLFPPLATLFKICTEYMSVDDCRNGSEVMLVPGDVVYISAYSFHRDAAYYEKPDEYWPERFDEELGGIQKYRNMGVFLPFGDGPRMCPGIFYFIAKHSTYDTSWYLKCLNKVILRFLA
uniref:Cytochrome P450 n=1 Tax=Stomoxys calcitrans TaxID=35570 RepID=A0A1I8PW51_STOCA